MLFIIILSFQNEIEFIQYIDYMILKFPILLINIVNKLRICFTIITKSFNKLINNFIIILIGRNLIITF